MKKTQIPLIKFKNVYKLYPDHIKALDDINLLINDKEFVCLVGPSGAGKSTLIKMINKEEFPTKGSIVVAGKDVTKLKTSQVPYLRRRVGMIFQDFKLLPKKTVLENVAFALEVAGESSKRIQKVVPYVLRLVGLADKKNSFPDELSGGEKQRVAIARALVHQPKIIVADEPTGNLDPLTAWGIIQLLLTINKFGTTIVMATHNKEIVNNIQKRVVTIENGKIVYDKKSGKYTL